MKICPVCNEEFEPKTSDQKFCGGGFCENFDASQLAKNATSITTLKNENLSEFNADDIGVKQLYATQSISTILIYFIWSAIALGVGIGFAYVPVIADERFGEPAIGWFIFGFLIAVVLVINGLLKASSDLRRSRL